MSPRVTRSSARQAAAPAARPPTSAPAPAPSDAVAAPPNTKPAPRKRKAAADEQSPAAPTSQTGSSGRRNKRQKTPRQAATSSTVASDSPALAGASRGKARASAVMEKPGGSAGPSNTGGSNISSASSSRKSSRSKKTSQEAHDGPSSSQKAKRTATLSDDLDATMSGIDDNRNPGPPPLPPPPFRNPVGGDDEEHEEVNEEDATGFGDHEAEDDEDDEDDDDPFGGFGGPGGPAAGLSNTLRALTGMMTGVTGRLRELLAGLKQDDVMLQMVSLQDLSELLLVSNEDNLSGHFSPDAFVKELVRLMSKDDQPEIMLLACRCLANLMEALPASVANVVYGNAVPVLCQKLLEISFIDLAEQSLSTLEKISYEYSSSIVREGGLTACLTYLDFFPTSTQRTAVTIAANCCRNIAEDSFPVVRDVMPTLLNVLNSIDQRVVEKASLCVTGIVDSFKYHPSELEELVSVDLLRSILRLLVPGTTNLIGSSIHTQFLRVLAFTARASPRLSAELFKLNVVETLYQILTGVSPPSGTDDVASKLDSVVIMQALIHRPREQIVETLNVICELLPNLPRDADPVHGAVAEIQGSTEPITPASTGGQSRRRSNEKRLELLSDCKDEVRRFALIIFPTLTDAFSSTVNLSVRQKVLTAHLKMLSNLDEKILVEALTPVPYASFLASILSQRDHPTLVMLGLQATELLLKRLDHIYRYQLYREGVIHEVNRLATEEEPAATLDQGRQQQQGQTNQDSNSDDSDDNEQSSDQDSEADAHDDDENGEHEPTHHAEDGNEDGEDGDEEDDNDFRPQRDNMSPISSRGSTMSLDIPLPRFASNAGSMNKRIREVAKKFMQNHENEGHDQAMKAKATAILTDLSGLATELESFYVHRTAANLAPDQGRTLFTKLASYFDKEVLESVTSAELLSSGLVRVLLEVFSNADETLVQEAQSTFLEVFMGHTVKSKPKTATADSPVTPFSILIHKLQDLLSRSEHFEVITVHQNSFDGNRSSPASMLGKQIRLRLVADEESKIPRPYRNIMVSIHAIATFKSLDDYLRPRVSALERPRGSRADGLSRALAAMAGASGAGYPLSTSAAARLAERSPFQHGSTLPPPPPPPPPPGASTPAESRHTRKSRNRSALENSTPATPSRPGEPSDYKAFLRNSGRQPTSHDSPSVARPPPEDTDDGQSTLECADEKQLSDEEDVGDASALDAIVDDLEDDMDERPATDPSAINMEVATGGNVTARKEDGTRVPTPAGSSASNRREGTSRSHNTSTPATPSSRSMSYASAVQATPKDWHIQFRLGEKTVPLETTIYRAVHTSSSVGSDEPVSRSIWSATHPIKFRRVPGPPPAESSAFGNSSNGVDEQKEPGIPASLAKHPATTSILRLLNILHDLNANVEDVLTDNQNTIIGINVEPLSQFVNTKLTAKLNRQLEEPLIVASNCLPSWSEDLARLYPFLFPFETRHLFLQSTSFGYARSMARWQNSQSTDDSHRDRHNDRPFLGRLQRQKVRISRTKILESALKVMELYGASQSILEVEYFEEVGTGLGPTLEFYSTVSKEFARKKLKLWRETDTPVWDDFVAVQNGLFPRPLGQDKSSTPNGERIIQLFKMLGKFVARSMIDSRIIDIHINPIFFRIGDVSCGGVKPSLGAVKVVDPGLARSLKFIKKFSLAKKEIDEDPRRNPAQKVADTSNIMVDNMRLEDLCLDFTLPGYPNIELEEDGAHQKVTIDNVDSYLEKVIDMTLGSGVRQQINAFRAGFSQVFPYSALSAFTPDELVALFGRVEEDWSLETLLDSIKADHGYNMDSRSVRNLLQTMSEFDSTERRDFLQFTTGSPKLPIGGFKSLTPMFTVVCKPSEQPYTSDDYLPSVMTCVNYLKLPNYSTLEVMKKQLSTAMKEGQGAFHLS